VMTDLWPPPRNPRLRKDLELSEKYFGNIG
jgi:hypothetical protein